MPSSAQEAAHEAALRLNRDRGREVDIAPRDEVATESLADLDVHVRALDRLFHFCATLSDGPLHVVLRKDLHNVMNVRGTGIPKLGEGFSEAAQGELRSVIAALAEAHAILLVDNGGLVVLYEQESDEHH